MTGEDGCACGFSDFLLFFEGLSGDEGLLTALDFIVAGDGERSTGGGKICCFATAAVFRLAELADRVTGLLENGDGISGSGDFLFDGDADNSGSEDW